MAVENSAINKNVLRNFGNGINQFIIRSRKTKRILFTRLEKPCKFVHWLRRLGLANFKDYKEVWTIQ